MHVLFHFLYQFSVCAAATHFAHPQDPAAEHASPRPSLDQPKQLLGHQEPVFFARLGNGGMP